MFRAVKLLCVILSQRTRDIVYLSKSREWMTPKVNPDVNYRF